MPVPPGPEDETALLRDLHDDYVWKVNAAVGEGREDLIADLVEEYSDAAMRLMAAYHAAPCERPGCPACARPLPPPLQTRRGLWKFLRG